MLGRPGSMIEFGFYKLNFILYLICVVWFLLLIIAPASVPADTIDFGDDGMVEALAAQCADQPLGDSVRLGRPNGA